MKIKTFETLKRMMELTFSPNDHECLAAIRAVNKLLIDNGNLTWTRVLNRTINVIAECEPDPENHQPEPPPRQHYPTKDERSQQHDRDAALLDEVERRVAGMKAMGFVESVRHQFELRKFMTTAQRTALEKMRDR